MKIILLVISVLASSAAFAANTGTRGGGKGIVCRDATGKIISAELLDLYEARVQHGYPVFSSGRPVEEQYSSAVHVLSLGRGNEFKQQFLSIAKYVDQAKVILPDGTELEPIDDSHHVVLPSGCKVEQLANYTDQEQILINGEIWSELDKTNKAALILHEALYKIFRMYGAKDSIRARKAIGFGMNGIPTHSLWEGVPNEYYDCHALPNADGSPFPGTSFRAYQDSNGILRFRFDYIDGQLMLTRSEIDLGNTTLEQLKSGEDAYFWLRLHSMVYDEALPVAVAFAPKEGSLEKRLVIGIREMPVMPTSEFVCRFQKK